MEKRRRLNSPDFSRINELSDDLLVLVLSRLTMKEAARTSILSHRWENLWVYYAGFLNFDKVTFNTRGLTTERPRFISWVNRVLSLVRGSTVDEVRVCFDLDASNSDDIERWMKFAIEKTVTRFELDFSVWNGFYIKWHDCFRFPSKLLDSPNNIFRPFGYLTSLRFISVDLSNEVLAYFISNCRSLEHLSIKGASSLTYFNATTALKLKCLEIEICHGLKNVDISNTNIESLNFNGEWETQSSLEKLHILSEVSLGGNWCYRGVEESFESLPISQLQSLELNLELYVQEGRIEFPEVFPTFCNLKHLKVSLLAGYDQNIFCLTSLICASPLLNSFTLQVIYTDESTDFFYELPNCEWRKTEKRNHQCLKVVEFLGWYGYKCDFDIVYYLIEKSVVLEKLSIDPNLQRYTGKRSALQQQKEKESRDYAKLLQKYVAPGTEFVIL